MNSKRLLQAVKVVLSKRSSNINGYKRALSFDHGNSLKSQQLFQSSRRVLFSNSKFCRICCNDIPVRYLKTNITPDNIVISPYDDVAIPNLLLHEFVWKDMDQWADKTAIKCSVTGRTYTFSQLRKACKKFAAALLKSGFKPGQVVAVVLPNFPDYSVAFLGAVEAGLIVSTVNPAYTADEISHQLLDSSAVGVITFAAALDTVIAATKKAEKSKQGSFTYKVISLQDFDGTSRPCPSGVMSLREMIENDIDTSIVDSANKSRDRNTGNVVVLPYSSGTTGLPKGVCLTHHNIVGNLCQILNDEVKHIKRPNGGDQDVLVAVLPFFHIYGLTVIMLSSIHNGGKLVTLPKFDPQLFLKSIKEEKCSLLYAVPPILIFMGNSPAVTKEHLEHIRIIVTGAAPVGKTVIEKVLTKAPSSAYLVQGYGMTETSPVAHSPPNTSRNVQSVGCPLSLTKAKVIDENGAVLGVGQQGELCVLGPQVMKEYLNKPDATAATIDKDGWLHTGDIAYFDEKGFFYITDRIKELIKVKGFQVAPAELEELLRTHPLVADVAVIGVPNAKAGEVPVAYVIPKPGGEQLTSENVQEFVANKVAVHKRLSKVIFTESIPKSASGKILRRVLRESYKEC